ncbi:hypothetical protein CDD81_5920 [Ophiocordyceps australis]|uniref:Mitochondrial fission process protein 1 n=1 Tax=Ophiocordyceps australis TaxID=1399860 RepID=A0A2C5XM39_9HYPO|nr:hypothetical protein CDD81_5920 [Ophiocordyceps australis]
MGWGGSSEESKKQAQSRDTNASSQASSTFDPNRLPEKHKLPKGLQNIIEEADQDSRFFDDLKDGYAPPSTDSKLRYAAYATRFRTLLTTAHRYVAYTSDIGESFRPVAHPKVVRSAYAISWAYIIGDVSYEGYKAYWQNQRVLYPNRKLTERQEKAAGPPAPASASAQPGKVSPLEDWRTVMVQRAVFQSIASMGLPALTIHSVVRYSGKALRNVKNVKVRTWAPIGLGLAVVPFLPSMFDEPVEHAVEWLFHKGFETFGGKQYVGDSPMTGREKLLTQKPKNE